MPTFLTARTKADAPICPYGCVDAQITTSGLQSTMVGWLSGDDPNHYTQSCHCLKCNREFVREWKRQSEWYAEDWHGKVLLGIPSCCGTVYAIPCTCGGHLTDPAKGRVLYRDGVRTPLQNTWVCNLCGDTVTELTPVG
jgi:hypothetical protein